MPIVYREDLQEVDWTRLKRSLARDRFDNGRTAEQLATAFQNSFAVCLAWAENQVVGTARVLSDGVSNAYLLDVWTQSARRGEGIGRSMVERLYLRLDGQHLYLQVDEPGAEFYRRLGFVEQPRGMSRVIGTWLAPRMNDSVSGK